MKDNVCSLRAPFHAISSVSVIHRPAHNELWIGATYLQDFVSFPDDLFQPIESPFDAPAQLLLEKWMHPDGVNGGPRTESALVTFPVLLASQYSSWYSRGYPRCNCLENRLPMYCSCKRSSSVVIGYWNIYYPATSRAWSFPYRQHANEGLSSIVGVVR